MEWYNNSDWNEQVKEDFENKLKKARGSYNKAEYLRIKGSTLLKTDNLNKQKVGFELLNRVITEYNDEKFHSIYAFEQIGDYYTLLEEYDKAIDNYNKVLDFYKKENRNGTSGIADIKIAEVIVEKGDVKKYFHLEKLLTEDFFYYWWEIRFQ